MFFKVNKIENEYHVLFSTGEIKYFNEATIGTFISRYDTLEDLEDKPLPKIFEQYDGTTVAILESNRELIVKDASILRCIEYPSEFPYYTVAEYADKHDRKGSIVLRYCKEKRFPGVITIGSRWLIPKNAPYPKDNRAGRDMSKRDYHVKKKK